MTTDEAKKAILEEFMKNGTDQAEMFRRFAFPLIHGGDWYRAAAKRLSKGVEMGLTGDDLFYWMRVVDVPDRDIPEEKTV